MPNSVYQQLKEARAKVRHLENKITLCRHHFIHPVTENVVFKTSRYSPMDGINVEGPEIYGFSRYQTCSICGLFQKSESRSPGEWSRWEDA